jgi:hypothetical protein
MVYGKDTSYFRGQIVLLDVHIVVGGQSRKLRTASYVLAGWFDFVSSYQEIREAPLRDGTRTPANGAREFSLHS